MSFYRIIRNKKGMGLTDFFSILAFVLIVMVFYFLIKLAIRDTKFELPTRIVNVEDSISLINIMKTPVIIDNFEISLAELITLSKFDSTKKPLVENTLINIMDNYFGTSSCVMMCIDGEKLKGNGCGALQTYRCPSTTLVIPSQLGKPIEVAFEFDASPVNLISKPLK